MLRIPVGSDPDVERARREAGNLARTLGFARRDVDVVALATSELARNLVRYARGGEITLDVVGSGSATEAIEIESIDDGPGIADVAQALEDGFSTGGGLGGGLGGVRRLMDDFSITTGPSGTRIVTRKWSTARP
jgi:serine/threonine-protein kinase RsbT